MNVADELQKLQQLHHSGALTDEEFAAAKAAVLARASGGEPADDPPLREHLEEIKLQNEVARLDREWELGRERYMITGKYGRRYVPNRGMSLVSGVVIGAFGLFWTVMAFSMTSSVDGPFVCFPLFGLLFIAFGVGFSIYSYSKAGEYEQAHRAYLRRRAELLDGPGRDEPPR